MRTLLHQAMRNNIGISQRPRLFGRLVNVEDEAGAPGFQLPLPFEQAVVGWRRMRVGEGSAGAAADKRAIAVV